MILSSDPLTALRAREREPTSATIEAALRANANKRISIGDLIGRLGERSFGIILFVLAVLSLAPGASGIAGVLLMIPAVQMMLAREAVVLPASLSGRQVQVERLTRVLRWVTPLLLRLERVVRPRWKMPFEATKRVVGIVVLLLGITLIAPIPLSNYIPGAVTGLLAFAYLEEDGVLLSVALAAAALSIAITGVEIWATLSAADWLDRL